MVFFLLFTVIIVMCGLIRPSMAMLDLDSMVLCGLVLPFEALYFLHGLAWPYVHGLVWPYVHGLAWPCMALHGHL